MLALLLPLFSLIGVYFVSIDAFVNHSAKKLSATRHIPVLLTRPLHLRESRLYFTGRLDNFISEDQIMFLKIIGCPLAVYLTFYKPIERTNMVFAKVAELLRVGESQNLLEGLEDYPNEDDDK